MLAVMILFMACSKTSTPPPAVITPSNLVIKATVSQDGTGSVDFKATAENAVSYKFEFGNGDIKDAPSGIITYKYTKQGTLTYTVKVTAYSTSGKTVSATTDITVTVSSNSLTIAWSDEFSNTGLPPERPG